MAEFIQSTSSPLTPKKVVEGLIATEAAKKAFFTKMKGDSADSVVQVVPAIQKEAGDQVTVALRLKITGDGITGDGDLEGNEVNFSLQNQSIKVDQRRQAIKLGGRMNEKRSAVKLRKEAVSALSTWTAEVDDEEIFYHISCARGARPGTLSVSYAGGPNAFVTPDAAHLYGGGGNTGALVVSAAGVVGSTGAPLTHKMAATDIDYLVEKAALTDPLIQELKTNGGSHLIFVISPEQATSLRQDTTWITAQRDANVRGDSNPVFSGAMGMYNGVVVQVHRDIVKFTDYYGDGTNVVICRAILLGAQAAFAVPGDNGWDYKEKDFDYANKTGFSVGHINGIAGAAFQPEGSSTKTLFGRILLDTAI